MTETKTRIIRLLDSAGEFLDAAERRAFRLLVCDFAPTAPAPGVDEPVTILRHWIEMAKSSVRTTGFLVPEDQSWKRQASARRSPYCEEINT